MFNDTFNRYHFSQPGSVMCCHFLPGVQIYFSAKFSKCFCYRPVFCGLVTFSGSRTGSPQNATKGQSNLAKTVPNSVYSWQTDTANIGNNSLHLMHSMQPKNIRSSYQSHVLCRWTLQKYEDRAAGPSGRTRHCRMKQVDVNNIERVVCVAGSSPSPVVCVVHDCVSSLDILTAVHRLKICSCAVTLPQSEFKNANSGRGKTLMCNWREYTPLSCGNATRTHKLTHFSDASADLAEIGKLLKAIYQTSKHAKCVKKSSQESQLREVYTW